MSKRGREQIQTLLDDMKRINPAMAASLEKTARGEGMLDDPQEDLRVLRDALGTLKEQANNTASVVNKIGKWVKEEISEIKDRLTEIESRLGIVRHHE